MITDAQGKRWRPLSPTEWRFLTAMTDQYRKKALTGEDESVRSVAKRVGLGYQRALKVTKHPYYQDMLRLVESRAYEQAGVDLARVQAYLIENRAVALGHEAPGSHVGPLKEPDLQSANRAAELLAKSAGLLVEKQVSPLGGDTYNTLIVGELKKQFTIDELRAMAAQLKGAA